MIMGSNSPTDLSLKISQASKKVGTDTTLLKLISFRIRFPLKDIFPPLLRQELVLKANRLADLIELDQRNDLGQ